MPVLAESLSSRGTGTSNLRFPAPGDMLVKSEVDISLLDRFYFSSSVSPPPFNIKMLCGLVSTKTEAQIISSCLKFRVNTGL